MRFALVPRMEKIAKSQKHFPQQFGAKHHFLFLKQHAQVNRERG
jgi:hypothetical protein